MQAPKQPRKVNVEYSPRYLADIKKLAKQHPDVSKDVDHVLNGCIIPAVTADPEKPSRQNGGTPVIDSTLSKRVGNSQGSSGRSGGFRMLYHWSRQKSKITLLAIGLRRDTHTFPHKAVLRLLKDLGL